MNDKHREAGKLMLRFLKQIAKDNGLSDEEIAKRSGFIKPNVNRMFSGRYMPTLENFIILGEAVGVRLELHAPEDDVSKTKVRSLDVPKFLFAPDVSQKELFILHTHYPACLIQVVQTIPATFAVIENYDTTDDFSEVLQDAREFYKNKAAEGDISN